MLSLILSYYHWYHYVIIDIILSLISLCYRFCHHYVIIVIIMLSLLSFCFHYVIILFSLCYSLCYHYVSARKCVEDTSHFIFFSAPFYITHRETLTARLNEILRRNNLDFIANTELYLYGHSSLRNLDNQKILAATIENIKNTNRFST